LHVFLCSLHLYALLYTPHPPPIFFFFFHNPAPTELYPLSLHDALPISGRAAEQSKWHRQTHRPSVRWVTRLAGWTSWTRTRSASSMSFLALTRFTSTQRARPSSLSTRSAPSSVADRKSVV